jgi:DNA-directed RNA polymerase III subunit RPC4
MADIPHYDNRYIPRREHEPRVNVDVLSGFAEDTGEGEPQISSLRPGQKSSGALPVGLFRTEHQEAELKVATTAELEAEDQQSDDGDLFVDPAPGKSSVDIALRDDGEVWNAASDAPVEVKDEPGTGGDAMDVDMSSIPVKTPDSPELKKKQVVNAEKERRREKALQDPEIQHMVLDTQALLQELSMDKEDDEHRELSKEGRLYLFQLPPILPPLVREASPESGDAEQSTSSHPESGSSSGPKIKTEDGTAETSLDSLPESGLIGKLNVRKSGKVEMDWGGTPLTLGIGTETDFLTTALMMETKEHPDTPGAITGVASGMGQVMGKFVLTPVWDEEDDWEPDLEGIVVDGVPLT